MSGSIKSEVPGAGHMRWWPLNRQHDTHPSKDFIHKSTSSCHCRCLLHQRASLLTFHEITQTLDQIHEALMTPVCNNQCVHIDFVKSSSCVHV